MGSLSFLNPCGDLRPGASVAPFQARSHSSYAGGSALTWMACQQRSWDREEEVEVEVEEEAVDSEVWM